MKNNNETNIEPENKIPNDNETTNNQEPPKKKSHAKIIIFGCLGIILFFIILLIAITLWGLSIIFDKEPLKNAIKEPDEKQLVSIAKKFGLDENTDNKENVAMQLLNTLMETEKTITLNKAETNTLIDYSVISGREYLKQKFPSATISNAYFEDGKLYVDASYKNSFSTPFGQYINMKIIFTPDISKKHLSLKINNLKVGSTVISGESLQKEVNKAITDFEKTEDGKMILEVITKLDIQKDSITVIFNPQKLTMMMVNQLQGSDGSIDTDSLINLLQ